ncbi:MAG: 50S ribosomal protein L15e [Nanoarchaeota archaeon]|nr:50S ribosomal protein L15e [Nanoarchaeota archaeon]
MGYLKYVRELWKKPKGKLKDILKERLIEWRKSNAVVRVEKPTRIDRARSLGYKAKQGIIIARVRALRGGRKRPLFKGGRRSKHRRRKKVVGKSYQWICEERANKKFINCEVLGSYKLAKDGKYAYFEVILVDKNHPAIKKDKELKWICEPQHRGRVYRGLSSSGRKSRGLRSGKGRGYEKNRPSLAAHRKRGKS